MSKKAFILNKNSLFFTLALMASFSIIQGKFEHKTENKDTWITIFVHGIIKIPWTPKDLYNIINNNVMNSRYSYAVEYLRSSNEYYLTQPMQGIGLREININSMFPSNASAAIASVYNLQYSKKIQNLYYTFGWIGLLSNYHRQEEAKKLIDSVSKELDRLKKINIIPKIRIIGFSHGGNVLLNMGKYTLDKENLPFLIDELILIGTPIQRENENYINSSLFKKIYNFYSDGDIAQTADFLTTKYGSSRRKFNKRNNFKLPDKLSQIKIRTTKIVHSDSSGKIIRVHYSDPRHMELWSFGWAERLYRCGFPLNPLPAISFAPLIIKNLEQNTNELGKDITVNIIPKKELIIFKNNCNKKECLINFSKEKFDRLKNTALKFKINYSYCEHVQLMKDAITYADEQTSCIK